MNELLNLLNEMLEEAGQEPLSALEGSLSLRDDLHMDSFMLAELTVRIEEAFEVDIFEDGIVQTLGEVVAKIEGK
ncbi:phosphopantetheine-binding protein [Paenibacillus sp. KS-LC4]|uniref:phosphopantetheine-binding protein n=1 Tax=Paenibacillus sp. KS-LC4 TaxID=2979727 RepID=UPI0030CC8862